MFEGLSKWMTVIIENDVRFCERSLCWKVEEPIKEKIYDSGG